MAYSRTLNLTDLLKEGSVFLFGARGTGKTTFLKTTYPEARYFDLLEGDTFRELSIRPELLRSLTEQFQLVIVDEIQLLPSLLNEIHSLIEKRKDLRFIITGSSARKLKRGSANLLAGRALITEFFPLTFDELPFASLERRLLVGSLPAIYDSKMPFDRLSSYVGTYLKEEVLAEGLTRGISNFSRFLEIAALSNTQVLNFTKIGSDAGISPRTIQNYFQILEDTLVGYMLPPFRQVQSRKEVATAKFYFFDNGVVNSLRGIEALSQKTVHYGEMLEHLIFLELKAYLSYRRIREKLTFWRTHSQFEVDFVIGKRVAIEVKSKDRIGKYDLRGLQEFSSVTELQKKIVVSSEKEKWITEDNIEIYPVQQFLTELWNGLII